MSWTIEVTGISDLKESLNKIQAELITKELLEELGNEAKAMILERTNRGIDVHGKRFKPYSKSYAAKKAKRGPGSGTVDLRGSGSMLESIETTIDVSSAQAVIGISDPRQRVKASRHNYGSGNGSGRDRGGKREFFGLGSQEIDLLTQKVRDHIKKVFEKKEGV